MREVGLHPLSRVQPFVRRPGTLLGKTSLVGRPSGTPFINLVLRVSFSVQISPPLLLSFRLLTFWPFCPRLDGVLKKFPGCAGE